MQNFDRYLNLVPFTATAFLITGQWSMFIFAVSVMPIFVVPIPYWAWKAIGQYPGTLVQVLSWHYFDPGTPAFQAVGYAMCLTMACQSNGPVQIHYNYPLPSVAIAGTELTYCFLAIAQPVSLRRVCFPSWSGFAAQQAVVLACQARFAWRATGGHARHFPVVFSLFAIVAIWTLQHHHIMLRDRRKSFTRLHRNRQLQKDVTLFAKAVDVMGKGLIVANAAHEIVHVNKTWCDITGFAKDDVVGRKDFIERPVEVLQNT